LEKIYNMPTIPMMPMVKNPIASDPSLIVTQITRAGIINESNRKSNFVL
jgi:hypothetical protein